MMTVGLGGGRGTYVQERYPYGGLQFGFYVKRLIIKGIIRKDECQ